MGQSARRHFLFLLCVLLVAAPLAAEAQRPGNVARIGILCGVRCEGLAYDALSEGLQRLGWIEGRNLTVDRLGAEGQPDRLPALAAELAALKPGLIVAVSPQANIAAKNAAGTIPIVMVAVADPIQIGLVQSFARPGGNITGLTTLVPGGILAKQMQLLKEALPGASRIAVFVNPTNEVAMKRLADEMPPAAIKLGMRTQVIDVRTARDIPAAVETAVRERADGIVVVGDPLFHTPPGRVPELVLRARLPTIFLVSDVAHAGGLMSYGPDFADMFRRAAWFVDKILKGTKPADLAVEQPSTYLFVINLKTAKTLGVTIPKDMLLRADTVIE